MEDLAAAIASEVARQLGGPAQYDGAGALLNAQQAAALLGVPATWVLAEARANRLPHVRLEPDVTTKADVREAVGARLGEHPGSGHA